MEQLEANGAAPHTAVRSVEENGGNAPHLELIQLLLPEGIFHVEQHQIQRAAVGL